MWPFEYYYNVQCFWLKRIWNIIIWAGFFREYWNKCFWRTKCFGKGASSVYAVVEIKWPFLDSTEISASEEPNALEKVPVQYMLLQKLSRKCHFLVRFCMSNWSETYPFLRIISSDNFFYKNSGNVEKTRMHSSRMHTVRNSSLLLGWWGGCLLPRGVPAPEVGYPSMHWGRPPCGQIDRCKKITFATSLRTVKSKVQSVF